MSRHRRGVAERGGGIGLLCRGLWRLGVLELFELAEHAEDGERREGPVVDALALGHVADLEHRELVLSGERVAVGLRVLTERRGIARFRGSAALREAVDREALGRL